MKNRKIKILVSFLTILSIVLTGVAVWMNPFSQITVSAGQYRNGYRLIPEKFDATGVACDSGYILLTQTDHTLEDIVEAFSIDGEENPKIEEVSSKKFIITPSNSLEPNKLYVMRIKKDTDVDITWTFQTGFPFAIVGSLPRHQSSGVPVNTGIEIYFSHEGYGKLDDYFQIKPDISGKFERHNNTFVFVPDKELQFGTIYEVTIKKGVALAGSDKVLEQDFVFSFETQPDENTNNSKYEKGWFGFTRTLCDSSTNEVPWIPVSYYINFYNKDKITGITVDTTVYSFGNIDKFMDALKQMDSIPYWAAYNYGKNEISTNGLEIVAGFQQYFPASNRSEEDNFLRLPDKLPKGFYLIQTDWEGETSRTLLQITDTGVYSVVTDKSTLIWLNGIGSNVSMENTKITTYDSQIFYADKDGLLSIDSDILEYNENNESNYLRVETPGGDLSVIRFERSYYYGDYRFYGINYSEEYWSTFQLDRQLYKPDDVIYFWGFLKGRDAFMVPGEVTVEIDGGYYRPMLYNSRFPFMYQGQSYEIVKVKVTDNFFDGGIKIPNLQSGSYNITVKSGDTVLAGSYITVEDYVKPAYKMEVKSDKKAVKNGEFIEFTIKTSFFEGTPVSNLPVEYSLHFYDGDQYITDNIVTDRQGEVKIRFKPEAKADVQGIRSCTLYAWAQLPESGNISASADVLVFVNDINVDINAKFINDIDTDKLTGQIDIKVNNIDMIKYNISDDNDYIGNPVEGKTVTGDVLLNTWERKEIGKYYDYINKVTYPRYEYVKKVQKIDSFTTVTDAEGKASVIFNPNDNTDGYYTVNLHTTDNSGREIKFIDVYVSGAFRYVGYYPSSYDRYHLYLEKNKFKLGEEVSMTYRFGEEPLKGGKYLFVKVYRGNTEWEIVSDPSYGFSMEQKYAPNIYVYSVWFNGQVNVVSPQEVVYYDYSDDKLTLTAHTDKEAYRPGETVTVDISSVDILGRGAQAVINISVVDEALFSLQNQYVDTLEQLYRNVSSGIIREFKSHNNSGRDVPDGISYEETAKGGESARFNSIALSMDMAAPNSTSQIAVREKFLDTAIFKTIQLDEEGKGSFSFVLPDNITKWRITLSGVSKDLKAGTDIHALTVSLPFFINYALSDTFLVDDAPVIGVTGYGTLLQPKEKIYYSVSFKDSNEVIATAMGEAFQRVNINLPQMKEGEGELVVTAVAENGLTDAVSHRYKVISTYRTMQTADYIDLTPYTVINAADSKMVTLIFTDKTRGRLLPQLYSLSGIYGNRFEQKLGARIAGNLLEEYFEQNPYEQPVFKAREYQCPDGGIGILPYSSSDVFVTAMAADLIKDEVDVYKLTEYLYGQFNVQTTHASAAAALYGLAALKEPVLIELEKFSQKKSLSTEEAIYVTLAYLALNEVPVAMEIYDKYVASQYDRYESYIRIKPDSFMKNKDDIIRNTVSAALAAAILDVPEAEKLMNYVRLHPTEESLINLQKIKYISQVIEKAHEGDSSVTYVWLGEEVTREIGAGESFVITVPGAKIDQFSIKAVEGHVGLITVYDVQRKENLKTDSGITVKRSYSKIDGQQTNIFTQGDIIQVNITVTINENAPDNYYRLTDFLPAGLRAVETPWQYSKDVRYDFRYKDIDGRKVSFYVYKYKGENTLTYSYYARIVSPGRYKAEGTVVQGINVLDSTVFTHDDTIFIQP